MIRLGLFTENSDTIAQAWEPFKQAGVVYRCTAWRAAAARRSTHRFVRLDYAPGSLPCTAIADDGDQLDRFVIEKSESAARVR